MRVVAATITFICFTLTPFAQGSNQPISFTFIVGDPPQAIVYFIIPGPVRTAESIKKPDSVALNLLSMVDRHAAIVQNKDHVPAPLDGNFHRIAEANRKKWYNRPIVLFLGGVAVGTFVVRRF